MDETPPAKLNFVAAISCIGAAQLISWGSLYYAIAVLAGALRHELRVSESELYAAFASSLALSGLLAPAAGRFVDRRGGRVVLSAGTACGAVGFALLGCARDASLGLLAFMLQGVAMALSLYDTCFAALLQQYPHTYRRAVTLVTLFGGLASTVFWPATHYLIAAVGWRCTCWLFASLLVGAALVNFLAFVPRTSARQATARPPPSGTNVPAPGRVRWLVAAFAGVSFVSAALAAHLPATLQSMRVETEAAVWIAASIGVMQVLGRAVEFVFGSHIPAARLGLFTLAAILAAILALLGSATAPGLAVVFALVYGAANGVLTVVGAVLPRDIFGTADLGAVLGRFAAPSRAARALAPWIFSLAATSFGSSWAVACLAMIAGVSLLAYVLAVPQRS